MRARVSERGNSSATKASTPSRAAPELSAPKPVVEEQVESVEKCINCQFYDRRHAKPLDGKAPLWGQCRRHAPQLNTVTAKAYVVEGIWPLVRDDDWCGEWKIILWVAEEPLPDKPAASDDLPPVGPREHATEAALGD